MANQDIYVVRDFLTEENREIVWNECLKQTLPTVRYTVEDDVSDIMQNAVGNFSKLHRQVLVFDEQEFSYNKLEERVYTDYQQDYVYFDGMTVIYFPMPESAYNFVHGGHVELLVNGKVKTIKPMPNSLALIDGSCWWRQTALTTGTHYTYSIKYSKRNSRIYSNKQS